MNQLIGATLLLLALAPKAFGLDQMNPPCAAASSPETAVQSLGESVQSITDRTESPLTRASRDLTRKIDRDAPARISNATLDDLWNRISNRLPNLTEFFSPNEADGRILKQLWSRLKLVVETLKKQGKFRYLDKDARKNLGIDHYLCRSPEKKYKEMLGLYVPLSNHILIDPDLTPDEAAKALFHELLHAEQFIYRFPADLEKLNEFVKDRRLKKEDVNSFLSAYYEYQANYQGMRYSPAQEWQNEFQEPGGKGLGWGVSNALTLGLADRLHRSYMNSHLPDVDQFRDGGITIGGGELAALTPSELVPVRSYSLGQGWYDLDWHYRFAKALNKTYFDDQVPTASFSTDDWKMQLDLHNNYYDHIGKPNTLEAESHCRELISEITAPGDAPLVRWLNTPQERIEQCPAYSQAPSKAAADQYANEILNSTAQGTPFVFAGGEGDRPGLRVYPVQPDLKVLPHE